MKIRFPGGPTAPARLVYNCRCTLISQIKGFEIDATKYRQDPDFKGMIYSEWKTAKAKSNKITAQEEKAAKIKQSYDSKYKNSIIKALDIDDFNMMAESNSISPDVSEIISSTIKEYEKTAVFFSQRLCLKIG